MLSIIVYWGQMKIYIFACSIASLLIVSWTALLQHSWLIFCLLIFFQVFFFIVSFLWLDTFKYVIVTWKPLHPQSIWFVCFVSGSYNSGKNIFKTASKKYHWFFKNHPRGGIWCFHLSRDFVRKCFGGRSAAVLVSESTIPARQAVPADVIWLQLISVSQA